MIPQNFKDYLVNEDNTGLFQTLTLLLFCIFFITLIAFVFSKSKNYYKNVSQLPLHDEDSF